jgi:hypothetical protein
MVVEDFGEVIAATVDTVPGVVSDTRAAVMDLADNPHQMRRLVLAVHGMLDLAALTVVAASTNAMREDRQAATGSRYGQGRDILSATDVTMIATARVTAAGTVTGTAIVTGTANVTGTGAGKTMGGRDTTKTMRMTTLVPSGGTTENLDPGCSSRFQSWFCWWVSLTLSPCFGRVRQGRMVSIDATVTYSSQIYESTGRGAGSTTYPLRTSQGYILDSEVCVFPRLSMMLFLSVILVLSYSPGVSMYIR